MAGMGPMKVLGHISESMAGVSAQHVKIDASSARDGLKPSSSIAFSLPQNALIDLDTLAIHGKVTVTKGRMPSAMSLIERFEVSIGGQVISGGSSFYGIAQAMLEANTGCRGDLVTEHGIVAAASTPYQGEHSVGAAGGNEVSKVTWSNFKTGFFGTCGTRVLDTSRLPIITFRITWAPIKVLVDAAATGYQIDNVFATMSVLTVSNPMYTAMQDAVISSKGFLPLPFKEFSTIQQRYCSRFLLLSLARSRPRCVPRQLHRDGRRTSSRPGPRHDAVGGHASEARTDGFEWHRPERRGGGGDQAREQAPQTAAFPPGRRVQQDV